MHDGWRSRQTGGSSQTGRMDHQSGSGGDCEQSADIRQGDDVCGHSGADMKTDMLGSWDPDNIETPTTQDETAGYGEMNTAGRADDDGRVGDDMDVVRLMHMAGITASTDGAVGMNAQNVHSRLCGKATSANTRSPENSRSQCDCCTRQKQTGL